MDAWSCNRCSQCSWPRHQHFKELEVEVDEIRSHALRPGEEGTLNLMLRSTLEAHWSSRRIVWIFKRFTQSKGNPSRSSSEARYTRVVVVTDVL
jgi:hypothetical protein